LQRRVRGFRSGGRRHWLEAEGAAPTDVVNSSKASGIAASGATSVFALPGRADERSIAGRPDSHALASRATLAKTACASATGQEDE